MDLRSIGLSLAIMLLSSCTIDIYYPNRLYGTIKHDTYTQNTMVGRLISGDTFTVAVPNSNNFYEQPHMYAYELMGKNYTIEVFGPIPSDDTIYRLMVGYKGAMPMPYFERKFFSMLVELTAKGDNRQMDKIYDEMTVVNGHPAHLEIFTQYKPGLYQYYSNRQPGDVTLTHVIYYVDYDPYGVIFWFQYSSDSGVNGINSKNRWKLIRQRYKPQEMFLRSFVITRYCCEW